MLCPIFCMLLVKVQAGCFLSDPRCSLSLAHFVQNPRWYFYFGVLSVCVVWGGGGGGRGTHMSNFGVQRKNRAFHHFMQKDVKICKSSGLGVFFPGCGANHEIPHQFFCWSLSS